MVEARLRAPARRSRTCQAQVRLRRAGLPRRYHPFLGSAHGTMRPEGGDGDRGVRMPRHHGRKQPAYYWAVRCAVAAEPSSHPETGLDLTNVKMSIPSQVDVGAGEPGYLDVGEHGCAPSGELPELNEHSLVTPARRVLLEKNGEDDSPAP